MKKVALIAGLVVASAIIACGDSDKQVRRDATSVGEVGWVFEGWACAPDTAAAKRGESPASYCKDPNAYDHLYLKFSAAASEKAIASGRIAMMQSTCRDAALTQIKGDGISKIIGDFLEQASGVADGQSTGVAIVRQSKGLIKGVGLYDCCSLNPKSGRCADPGKGDPETWEQCQCVGYMKFPGGKKAFETQAQQAQSGGN
ncbi:MAG: lipoprotein LipL21 [Spirochaetia bacterium]|nr:lipoprotein LipL21 [Spirochaetia bacterium]